MKLEQAARQIVKDWDNGYPLNGAINMIEEALVATTLGKDYWLEKCMDSLDTIRAAKAQEQTEHEPVGYIDAGDLRELSNGNERQYSLFAKDKGRMVAIYAAPVRTKDLTGDEIASIGSELAAKNCVSDIAFARAIIAAYKEKNK